MRRIFFFPNSNFCDRYRSIYRFFDRFWSTFRIFVDSWPNLGYGGFRGRWIEWHYSFFLKIDICGRIDRFDSAKLIASGRLFESLSILDQTSDMGVFGDAESNGAIRFSWKSIFVVESIDSTVQNWSLLVVGRLVGSLSILDQTSDMRVFGGAESNGAIRFSWKSIFVVESID